MRFFSTSMALPLAAFVAVAGCAMQSDEKGGAATQTPTATTAAAPAQTASESLLSEGTWVSDDGNITLVVDAEGQPASYRFASSNFTRRAGPELRLRGNRMTVGIATWTIQQATGDVISGQFQFPGGRPSNMTLRREG